MLALALVFAIVWPLFVFAAELPSQNGQSTATLSDRKASLRLTHLLYAAVLDHYAAEGLEKYRPAFLIHERYLRTFLFEWGLALEKQNEKESERSTKEIWSGISKRPSYLGANFNVWMQTVPHAFDLKDDGYNIGYMRESFLVALLKSEDIADFNARSQVILELTSKYLMTQSADQELGLKILNAFKSHPDVKLQDQSRSLIRNFPALSKTVAILGLTRDVALGFALTPQSLTSRLSTAVVSNVQKARATELLIRARISNAIRLPELVAGWRRSSLTRAFAYSGAIHTVGAAAIAEKMNLEGKDFASKNTADAEILAATFRDSTSTSFLTDISLNTASVRSPRLLEQHDFALPAAQPKMLSREQWIAAGTQALMEWNQTGTSPKGFSFSDFILQGERIHGKWPKNEPLTYLSTASRYAKLKRRIIENKIADIESLRADVLKNELEDYRKNPPYLTGMLLDWGGNCVSQTYTLISLLLDFPKLIPKGYQLGIFEDVGHREAVIISNNDIKFLVSGKVLARPSKATVFKPQVLIAMALVDANADTPIDPSDYYLNGKPGPNDKTSESVSLQNLKRKVEDFLSGDVKFKRSPFKVSAGGGDLPDVPDQARTEYQAFGSAVADSDGASPLRSFFSRLSLPERSNNVETKRTVVPSYYIPTEAGWIEVCLVDREDQEHQICKFEVNGKINSPRNTRVTAEWYNGTNGNRYFHIARELVGKTYLGATLHRDDIKTLLAQPKELWMLQINRWMLERIAFEYIIGDLPQGFAARAKQMRIETRDLFYLQREQTINGNSSALSLLQWQRFAQNAKPDPKDEAKSEIQAIFELSKGVTSYTDLLSQRYQNRPDFLPFLNGAKDLPAKFGEWYDGNQSILALAKNNPAAFVRAFTQLDPKVKQTVVVWARLLESKKDLNPLRDYLDKLQEKQIVLKELIPPVILKKPSLDPAIRTPICKEGCSAFIVLKNEPKPTELQREKEQKTEDASQTARLHIAPVDVALLSLLSSGGGLQLWNDKVYAAVTQNGPAWRSADIGPLKETDRPIYRIWGNLGENYGSKELLAEQTAKAVEKALNIGTDSDMDVLVENVLQMYLQTGFMTREAIMSLQIRYQRRHLDEPHVSPIAFIQDFRRDFCLFYRSRRMGHHFAEKYCRQGGSQARSEN